MAARIFAAIAVAAVLGVVFLWWGPGRRVQEAVRVEPATEQASSRVSAPPSEVAPGKEPSVLRGGAPPASGPLDMETRAAASEPPVDAAFLGREQAIAATAPQAALPPQAMLAEPAKPSDAESEAASDLVRKLEEHYQGSSDEDMQERLRARDRLVAMGARAVPALLEAAAGADEAFGAEIQSALGEMGSEAIPALVEGLSHPSTEAQKAAATALGTSGSEAAQAVPELLDVSTGQDVFLAITALNAVVEIGSEALPALVEALGDPDAAIRWSAVYALGEMGPVAKPSIGTLQGLVYDENAHVRDRAIIALNKIEQEG